MDIVLWLLALLLVGIAILLWRSFFPAYFSEKGKNLATKEDIAKITHEVEKVRSLYASQLQDLQHRNELLLEQVRSRQQLRMAALEKRLQAHQEAYVLWRKLMSNLSSADLAVIMECQQWWISHCLYLDPAAREAFLQAYSAAATSRHLIAPGSGATAADIRTQAQIVMKAGEAIVKGVELPPLGELETRDVTEKTTRDIQKDAG
jgi:hypothetical protein